MKASRSAARQRIRTALLVLAFVLFPATLIFFSPYIPFESGTRGILNGSLIVFGLMFLASLLVGRLYCGWLCPGAGLMEASFAINDKPVGFKWRWVKWAIWIPWAIGLAAVVISAGGYRAVDPFFNPFYSTGDNGVPVISIGFFVIYFVVTGAVLALSVFAGKRGFCHTLCWMAPFMILGRKLNSLLRLPALRLGVTSNSCVSCHRCEQVCPMSLHVAEMAKAGKMDHLDCILCGSCVDICPKRVIAYRFAPPPSSQPADVRS